MEKVNKTLEREGLKIQKGNTFIAGAAVVPSARRPRRTLKDDGSGNITGPEYSDDPDAAWTVKAGKAFYGYRITAVTGTDGPVESISAVPANESETTAVLQKNSRRYTERCLNNLRPGANSKNREMPRKRYRKAPCGERKRKNFEAPGETP